MRNYSAFDNLIMNIDQGMRTLFAETTPMVREYPATEATEGELTTEQRQHIAGLMRINHAGEVSAQALYQGQALTAQLKDVRDKMEEAASEEIDHLAWCELRLEELSSHTSRLNPVWYAGSLLIGATAGLIGDRWSLGFVAETERQVVRHLQDHLAQLPPQDKRTQAILNQMQEDEAHHATVALEAGGEELPVMVKTLMKYMSKVMTNTAYYV